MIYSAYKHDEFDGFYASCVRIDDATYIRERRYLLYIFSICNKSRLLEFYSLYQIEQLTSIKPTYCKIISKAGNRHILAVDEQFYCDYIKKFKHQKTIYASSHDVNFLFKNVVFASKMLISDKRDIIATYDVRFNLIYDQATITDNCYIVLK